MALEWKEDALGESAKYRPDSDETIDVFVHEKRVHVVFEPYTSDRDTAKELAEALVEAERKFRTGRGY